MERFEREFDLNIGKILEGWEVYHAIREIIANALDEQIITKTKEISIYKSNDDCWHVVDYGRGLNYHHLTQDENEEKLNNDELIGRFGVGLKDALATLYRHGIKVKITSKYGIITLKQSAKVGFDDVITLHAEIAPAADENMVGTDFSLDGCSYSDIEKAKALFLKFTNKSVLESTIYGQVIKNDKDGVSDIYINGVKVAEEPNFLFSYNITSLTAVLKKSLNRERTNVGRSAYTDRVKSILLKCESVAVINLLAEDLQQLGSGLMHDEMKWSDVQLYASTKLRAFNSKVTFVTTTDLEMNPSLIDSMKTSGYSPVVVSDALAGKMEDYNKGAKDGETFTTSNQFIKNEESRFIPMIVDVSTMSEDEKNVYSRTDEILNLIGGKPCAVKEILISEQLYAFETTGYKTVGVWNSDTGIIYVHRDQLVSLNQYAGTLLHECAHALDDTNDDVSRAFEIQLTDIIGILAEKILS